MAFFADWLLRECEQAKKTNKTKVLLQATHESSEICVCGLEKLSSILDSMAINLSRSISIDISEPVSWFPSISTLFCLFRFVVGLSAELELDEHSERLNMSTSSEYQIF